MCCQLLSEVKGALPPLGKLPSVRVWSPASLKTPDSQNTWDQGEAAGAALRLRSGRGEKMGLRTTLSLQGTLCFMFKHRGTRAHQ